MPQPLTRSTALLRPASTRASGAIPFAPAPMGRRVFKISEIAQDFGVTLRALRFYEVKGMLVPRRRGTTRVYTLADRERLATILKGKQLGFTLREIQAMLVTSDDAQGAPLALPPAMIAVQTAVLEAQLAEVQRALASLRAHAAAAQADPAHATPALVQRVRDAFEGDRP